MGKGDETEGWEETKGKRMGRRRCSLMLLMRALIASRGPI